MEKIFENKVAIVTGGSFGVGQDITGMIDKAYSA
jgi:NAD(P)-dependent dehydrogenase (short-subunit alcohol dehydrogenase family)